MGDTNLGSCCLTLASKDGDTFTNALVSDVLIVSNNFASNGAILAGFQNSASSNVNSSFRIDQTSVTVDGNVGIHTSTPLCALDVTGDIRSTGLVYATGFVVINNTGQQGGQPGQVLVASIPQSSISSSSSSSSSVSVPVIATATTTTTTTDIVTYLQNKGGSNIGIGLSNPVFPLDVASTTNFASNLLAPGFSNVGGYTFTQTLSNARDISVGGTLTASYLVSDRASISTISNIGNLFVGGTVYTSNIVSTQASIQTISNIGDLYVGRTLNVSNVVAGIAYIQTISNVSDVYVGGTLTASNVKASNASFMSCSNAGGLFVGGAIIASNLIAGYASTQTLSNFGAMYVRGDLSSSNIVTNDITSQTISNAGGMYVSGPLVSASTIGAKIAYFQTTSNYGDASFGGTLSAPNIITTFALTSVLSNAGNMFVGKLLRCSNLVANVSSTVTLCNIGDVTVGGSLYASTIMGANLSNCTLPYASVIGAPVLTAPSGTWNIVGASICAGTLSNVGIGTTTPMCALDVSGDLRTTGAVYASSFVTLVSDAGAATATIVKSALTNIASISNNKVINGGMIVDQRNGGVALSLANQNAYIADRFSVNMASATGSVSSQTTTLPAPLQGFTKCLLTTVSSISANPVPGAYEVLSISQCIEGYNIADLQWGTSSASSIIVSFWVYSSFIGTFTVSVSNNTSNLPVTRSFVSPFTIINANTWTRICIPILGDTTISSNWANAQLAGAVLTISYMCGSALCTSLPGNWLPGYFLGVQNQTNMMSVSGAAICITGVQFEIGTVATRFESRSYITELQLCQRYCHVICGPWQAPMNIGKAGLQGLFVMRLPVEQRTSPVVSFTDAATPSSGVFVFGTNTGLISAFNSIVVFDLCLGTQDISLVASWASSTGLTIGQMASSLIGNGARLLFVSEF